MPFPPPPVDAIDTVLAYEDELREYARQQDARLPEERVVVLDGTRVYVHHGYGFVDLSLGRRFVNSEDVVLDADPFVANGVTYEILPRVTFRDSEEPSVGYDAWGGLTDSAKHRYVQRMTELHALYLEEHADTANEAARATHAQRQRTGAITIADGINEALGGYRGVIV